MATPVIGAVNGATFTGGLELALRMRLPDRVRARGLRRYARRGSVCCRAAELTARLPPLVGPMWARRMSYAGEVIDAERALRIGLVTELVAHERLLDRAVELAAMVAEVPAETMRAMKTSTSAGRQSPSTRGSRPSGPRRPSTGRTLRSLSSGG